MKQTAIWAATFLLFVILVFCSGCAKDEPKIEPKAGVAPTGGKISIGSATDPETWNPYLSDLAAVQDVGRLLFAGLLLQNEKGEWITDLAAEIPTAANGGVSADGMTLTFRLKPGLKWQDGQAITSRDIDFTYQFILKNRSQVSWREGYEKILSISLPDTQTAVVRLAEPYGYYLHFFSYLLPSHRAADLADPKQQNFNRLPVGSGPFILKEWRRGDALVFEANPLYHRGRAALDSVLYKVVPDRQIVLSQLKIGEVDIVNHILWDQMDQLFALTGVNTNITRGVVWEHLDMNLDNPLFLDVRVRQAIALAIDRVALVEKVLKNAAFPAYTDIHPSSWAYNSGVGQSVTNPVRARELLISAGWSLGYDGIMSRAGRKLSFTLTIPTEPKSRELVAETLVKQLREIGIEVRLQKVTEKIFFGDVLPNRRFEAVLFAWVNSSDPDNYDLWHSRRIPSAVNRRVGKNFAGWRSSETDYLLDSMKVTADQESRRNTYWRIQELLQLEAPVVPLYYRADISAAKRSVDLFKPNPFSGNLWNAWEWRMR